MIFFFKFFSEMLQEIPMLSCNYVCKMVLEVSLFWKGLGPREIILELNTNFAV